MKERNRSNLPYWQCRQGDGSFISTKAELQKDYQLMLDNLRGDLVLSHNENLETIKDTYAELDKDSRASINLFNESVNKLVLEIKLFESQQFKNNTIIVFVATLVSSILTVILFKYFTH